LVVWGGARKSIQILQFPLRKISRRTVFYFIFLINPLCLLQVLLIIIFCQCEDCILIFVRQKTKGQSRMENLETLATMGTQVTRRRQLRQ
jgi:predicted membrane protein